jgi:hypothetical protein
MRIPYTLSPDSITVFAGGKMLTVLAGHKNFDLLCEHLRGSEHDPVKIVKLADREQNIRDSAAGSKVEIIHGTVYYENQELNNALTNKLLNLLDGGFDATPWVKFLEKLMLNPSFRSRECLFGFLENFNAPITPEGNFIAFKRIRQDWKDIHSGTMDNSVGTVVQMDRAKVDDDPQHTCSSGLHVCADQYLTHFADAAKSRTVVVEVNPANVVAVPYDYNFAKMRVCEYKVVEEIEPARIPEILDSEMYGDYYSLEDDFNYPDEEDTDFWDDEEDDAGKCGDPDCWCAN